MMYYSDLLGAAEKDTSSRNFCNLVDAAVLFYEEEQQRKGKSKCNSTEKQEEEESDKRFFHLFPRKSRTSVKRFVSKRNPQQNPNVPSSSSSSSLLADSATEDTRNPNSQSSLSSCLTESKTRKRRAVQESKRSTGKTKKAKVDTFSWEGRETPEWLTQFMKDTNETVVKWGERTDLSLIFERTLFKTDVNPAECRLSMPFNELIRKDFLTPVESRIIEEDINNVKKIGIGAILVDQRNVKWGVMLKRWEMKKDSGKGSWNYALTCGWNEIVKANGLEQGHDISIWSFRWGGLLCFALVTPPPSMAQSSSSLALCL
ncbi:B3 domain-containing protein At3g25182-like [Eutrema salsugineum]|uniref:B3 domain-containing protein At3g25182-like n=1 Tax=Eutrema salsugineum TaxID=72664 RepID=UPI000CECF563|nr:B3 domain-containing protein At3g25182-like [Eutrema salsugineum]